MNSQDPIDPPGAAPPRKVGVREFRGNMTTYLREVQEGVSLLITSRDQVVAELRPPPSAAPRRQPGGLKGRLAMAPDFDSLPPELLAAMEGSPG